MAVEQTLTCNLWAAIIDQNGVPISPLWNGDPKGYPGYVVTNNARVGLDFTGPQIPYPTPPPPGLIAPPRTPLYLSVTGDNCTIRLNTGAFPFQLNNGGLSIGIPGGYKMGWPDQGGLPATLDSELIGFDSVPPVADSPYIVSFGGNGYMQVGFPQSIGNYYVEYTVLAGDVFTRGQGAGISRRLPDVTYILNGYEYNSSDANGGAGTNGDFGQANGGTTTLSLAGSGAGVNVGTTVGLAISIFPAPAVFTPYDIHPIALKCFPCNGILATRKAAARMG